MVLFLLIFDTHLIIHKCVYLYQYKTNLSFPEPGVVLSPGASGSKGAKEVTWKLRTGITMQFDRSMVYIGYGISDFSLYSGRPYNQHGLPSDDNYITHSVFIGMAYKF